MACGNRVGLSHSHSFVLIYFGIGIAVYYDLRRAYRKSGAPLDRLSSFWRGLEITLMWPTAAVLARVWLADFNHLKTRRLEKEQEAASKRTDKYSGMNLDELLAAQEKAMSELPSNREKNSPPS